MAHLSKNVGGSCHRLCKIIRGLLTTGLDFVVYIKKDMTSYVFPNEGGTHVNIGYRTS